jgi:hypothetical protein
MSTGKYSFFNKDILSGGIFFIFGLVMLTFIIPAAVPVSFVPPGQISPRFLPKVITVAITGIGLFVLLLALLKRKKEKAIVTSEEKELSAPEAENANADNQNTEGNPLWLKLAPVFSMLVVMAYFFLMIWTGFLVSSIFAMLAIMIAFGERRWLVLIVASIVVPVSAWVFAVKLLKIPMP